MNCRFYCFVVIGLELLEVNTTIHIAHIVDQHSKENKSKNFITYSIVSLQNINLHEAMKPKKAKIKWLKYLKILKIYKEYLSVDN